MHELERAEFDLAVPAPNGLRRGRTTGSCATAAVKAALTMLLRGARIDKAEVSLPDGRHYLVVPIQDVQWLDAGDDKRVRAEVLKDGGDDPDNTHGATIFAEVARNDAGEIRFLAASGVGTATRPGLRVAVGEPAINPVPRRMMRLAVAEVLEELHMQGETGFDLAIGCEDGQQIARKTFNPRLGIVGGISILGTSGIVEPMSLASWIASIEVYIRVALADESRPNGIAASVAYLPGKIGRTFARDELGLPEARSVQIANFLGDALDFTQAALAEQGGELEVLWLAGHPGKLAKVLDGVWDTHSGKSNMAMGGVARVAAELATELGFSGALIAGIESANTVEAAIEHLRNEPGAAAAVAALWRAIEARIAALAQARVPSVRRVEVRLFDLDGNLLGGRV
ncbi:cobalt-precorrin-5B (C(1))-methyltransferase CbiD [Herbaspirillum sp. RV1423]|uniref:cobalt-precorrin-5B (C(1))-methyltransferase CbiD n=1 Tax=Herbaspirillum sp. RV1423 TaxID=1443993 RepID=UPI0004B3D980|nr:cobalt-precorrin-5B (C(1))-methyltransferase CbiD [Herbaspirillum sp. RV1423]